MSIKVVNKILFGTGLAALTMSILQNSAFADGKPRIERCNAQEVYFNGGDEPPSMDPTKQADSISGSWLGHLYEGLMTTDKNNRLIFGTAESVTVSKDGTTYTYKIRANAKWHDGKPVSAKDFVFAFKRLVDPVYASEYSFIALTAQILNAQEILDKKKDKEELGVKAIDDSTLEIKLKGPNPIFPMLMAFQTFYPVRKDLVEKQGDKFNTSVQGFIGNGPFKMVEWTKEKSMRIEKADTYWNAKEIKLKAIEAPSILKDAAASYNQFITGSYDIVGLDPDRLKAAQKDKFKIQTFGTGSIFYMELNMRNGKVFSNAKLRQALRYGINRSEYINKIIAVPGFKPGFGIVPDDFMGVKKSYRAEAPLKWKDGDTVTAKKLIKEYLAETKQTKVPSFTILSGDSTRSKKFTEYFQGTFSKLFETEVKVDSVPFKTRLQKMKDADFDIVMAGWGPDYNDPMTFMDLYTSWNENNHTGYASKDFDELIKKANIELDPAKRVALMAEAEKILIEKDAPIISTDQAAGNYTIANGLTGVVRKQVGADPDWRFAEWKDCAKSK